MNPGRQLMPENRPRVRGPETAVAAIALAGAGTGLGL
jgi:hypothetical protein